MLISKLKTKFRKNKNQLFFSHFPSFKCWVGCDGIVLKPLRTVFALLPPAKARGYKNTNLVTEYLYNCVSVTLHFSAGIVDSELVLCFSTIFFIQLIVCLGRNPFVVGCVLYHQLK
jgi:hypothetical protein